MNDPAPGRLITLSAREVWGDEAQVFTPWLARHLDLLAEALQLGELELRGTEVTVGDFRLDILAEDSSGDPVVIENQFGRTDHGHLGQLISYVASQNRAATTIWVAEQFKDSHRAAIDWLNDNTTQEHNFFAVEIEALRIGDSAPAPFFNVVAKPNTWTKSARIAASTSTAGEQERHRVRAAYWNSFAEFLRANDATFSIRREVRDHWFNFPIGRSGIVIGTTISAQKRRCSVELYVSRDVGKRAIRQLMAERAVIESEVGTALDWQELPNKQASRVATYLLDADPSDPEQFDAIHQWMLGMMKRFKVTFAERVKRLNLAADED